MTAPAQKISFVTWPDGRVDEQSVSSGEPRRARTKFLQKWLLEQYFGPLDGKYTVVDALWREAQDRGCRCYVISIEKNAKGDMVPKIESGW